MAETREHRKQMLRSSVAAAVAGLSEAQDFTRQGKFEQAQALLRTCGRLLSTAQAAYDSLNPAEDPHEKR